MNSKILVFRLSAMGDLILSTAFLESLPADIKVHWVTRKEWAPLLQNHPRIEMTYAFDPADGLKGWIRLIQKLSQQDFSHWVDLHQSLRTKIAFCVGRFFQQQKVKPQYLKISKQRLNLWGFFVFKKVWPKYLRPLSYRERFSQVSAKIPQSKLNAPTKTFFRDLVWPGTVTQPSSDRKWFAVMPSSKWPGKEWPVEHWLELFSKIDALPVILGTKKDQSSQALIKTFPKAIDATGISLEKTAAIISAAPVLVGVDTGLAHLAESLNVPVITLFGPTHPDMGFGPSLPQSISLGSDLWCRPCSKDGTACFRVSNRFKCLNEFTADQVLPVLNRMGIS